MSARSVQTQDNGWGWAPIVLCSLLFVAAILTGCVASVEPHPPVHVEVVGAASMESLAQELADAYAERHEYATFDVVANSSGLGLEALRDGLADVALVTRELAPEEVEGLAAAVIAYDAVAILVNDQNPVGSLSVRELRDIFSGDILVWSDVGGEEVDIQVLSREDGSGTREAFEEMVMGGKSVTLTAIVIPSSQGVGEYVGNDPVAIGYDSAVAVPDGVKALSIDGVRPDLKAVMERDYALIRPLTLVTQGNPDDEVQAFVDFVLSPAGQAIVGQRYGRAR
ncbi:MAG: solute-binding protein [Anaerolineae bacterium]|nr:solute-binding protein [Anaerolineae bacterium]NIN96911.1 solute-binding protein [Anaerolineae bacterium]NIQ79876.1 solute-binding protein [Anaerolineae bacterium]